MTTTKINPEPRKTPPPRPPARPKAETPARRTESDGRPVPLFRDYAAI